jgi:hypothetical protein
MKIGFTGSKYGMTPHQCQELKSILSNPDVSEFHHGLCKGADEQAHEIALARGLFIIGHPPILRAQRAKCKCNEMRLARQYIARNRDIVDETDLLIVAPHKPEYLRSGTWSTKRYAERIGKKFHILEKE